MSIKALVLEPFKKNLKIKYVIVRFSGYITSCVYFHNVLMCIAWCNQYCSDIDFQIPNWVGYFFKFKFMSQKKSNQNL